MQRCKTQQCPSFAGEVWSSSDYIKCVCLTLESDEFYPDLYEFEVALEWLNQAETLVLMSTSNAVGITEMAVSIAIQQSKKIVVVDPNPAPSLLEIEAEVFRMKATEFCKMVFKQA